MNFETCINIEEDGIRLLGTIPFYYHELVEIFGIPDFGPDNEGTNSSCLWSIKFEDGTIATVYDWHSPLTPRNRYQWHIGGYDNKAFKLVKALLQYKIDN